MPVETPIGAAICDMAWRNGFGGLRRARSRLGYPVARDSAMLRGAEAGHVVHRRRVFPAPRAPLWGGFLDGAAAPASTWWGRAVCRARGRCSVSLDGT